MPQINWINQLLVSFAQSLMACRALTYMLEALPQSAAVMGDAIPVLIDKVTRTRLHTSILVQLTVSYYYTV